MTTFRNVKRIRTKHHYNGTILAQQGSITLSTHDIELNSLITILPFEDLSGDSDQHGFCADLERGILYSLSGIENLSITARFATAPLEDTRTAKSEIGQKATLFAVLKGSVEKTGDQCKTLVKLVSASGDHQFWAGLYYHDPQGVDGIQ